MMEAYSLCGFVECEAEYGGDGFRVGFVSGLAQSPTNAVVTWGFAPR
jgi:hypothetical protein